VIGAVIVDAARQRSSTKPVPVKAPPSIVKAQAAPAPQKKVDPDPPAEKGPDVAAMLRAARQLDSFGRIQAGVEAYREVIKQFPESKEAEFARTRLKAMGEDSN
jgi:hypothetical protein